MIDLRKNIASKYLSMAGDCWQYVECVEDIRTHDRTPRTYRCEACGYPRAETIYVIYHPDLPLDVYGNPHLRVGKNCAAYLCGYDDDLGAFERDINQRLESIEDQIARTQGAIREAGKTQRTIENEIETIPGRIGSLRGRVKSAVGGIERARHDIERTREELRQLEEQSNARTEELKRELHSLEEQSNRRTEELKRELRSLEMEADRNIRELAERVHALAPEVAESAQLTAEVSRLNNEYQRLQRNIGDITSDDQRRCDGLRERITECRWRIADRRVRIAECKQRHRELASIADKLTRPLRLNESDDCILRIARRVRDDAIAEGHFECVSTLNRRILKLIRGDPAT